MADASRLPPAHALRSPDASTLQCVRHATRELHERVERTALMREAVPPPPRPVDVPRFLEASARFVPMLEARLAPALVPAGLGHWRASLTRTAALEHDLGRELRCRGMRDTSHADRARVLALLYVLEGSRLGVRAIAQRVPSPDRARWRSLDVHLPAELSWPGLCREVDALAGTARERFVLAASDVFRDVLATLSDGAEAR